GQSAQAIREATQAQQQARAAQEPNALPTDELERAGSFVVPFEVRWRAHEEARSWALEVLAGRVTCATDGSQLLPGREINLPVAAVQVASFENPHTADGRGYRKEAHFELVTPDELLATDGGKITAADIVGLRRFALELRVLGEFMERKRGWQARGERVPVALFDGTLLISAAQIRTESNFPTKYIEAVARAVRLSRDAQVPLVGFVDQSYARDIASLLDVPAWIYEAGLLDEVLDTVRAECVVGNGYPYALETADEAAYISGRDRAQFMRALQEFAEREQMPFRVARKAISKAHRR